MIHLSEIYILMTCWDDPATGEHWIPVYYHADDIPTPIPVVVSKNRSHKFGGEHDEEEWVAAYAETHGLECDDLKLVRLSDEVNPLDGRN